MGKRKVICGIYKITSPSGNIYIGKSTNIYGRWVNYRNLKSVESQPILHSSLSKYGWESHIFEIVEEYLEEDLSCRERFWQDYYDVTGKNGLNCRLEECGEKKIRYSEESIEKWRNSMKGSLNHMSKDLIDVATGVFYESMSDACESTDFSYSAFRSMLYGKSHNKTTIIKCEDYENGLLPNTLKVPKPRITPINKNEDLFVINIKTEVVYFTAMDASKREGVNNGTLRAYLRGVCSNPTDLMYYRDFKAGLKKEDIFKGRRLCTEVIDLHTKEEYESISSLARFLGVTIKVLITTLDSSKNNMSRYIYLRDYDENKEYSYNINTLVKEIIIDLTTMKEYSTLRGASRDTGINYTQISKMLKGESYNYSSLMYKDDYERGLNPNSYTDKLSSHFRMLDTETGVIYPSVRELKRHFKLGRNFLQTQTRFIRII